jgi:hypothetical protein
MSPNTGGRGELRGLSQRVQLCTWSPNELWRSNSIFNQWLQMRAGLNSSNQTIWCALQYYGIGGRQRLCEGVDIRIVIVLFMLESRISPPPPSPSQPRVNINPGDKHRQATLTPSPPPPPGERSVRRLENWHVLDFENQVNAVVYVPLLMKFYARLRRLPASGRGVVS